MFTIQLIAGLSKLYLFNIWCTILEKTSAFCLDPLIKIPQMKARQNTGTQAYPLTMNWKFRWTLVHYSSLSLDRVRARAFPTAQVVLKLLKWWVVGSCKRFQRTPLRLPKWPYHWPRWRPLDTSDSQQVCRHTSSLLFVLFDKLMLQQQQADACTAFLLFK